MLTIIPLIAIITALGIILLIAARHLPNVMALDVDDIPQERQARLKSTILEKQLFRKIYALLGKFNLIVFPIVRFFVNWHKKSQQRLRLLERIYKFHSGSPLPDSDKKVSLKVDELSGKAGEALAKNDFKEAEDAYLAIIKIAPQNPEAFEGLGETYIAQGEWEQASETFTHLTKHWPERDLGYASLAEIAQAQGNWEQAKDYYLHALSINNQPVKYHLNLAQVYSELSENELALSSLQKAQALEPNNPKVLDQLLEVSIILKNKPLASEVLDKIKKINPEHGKLKELEKKVKSL